MRLSVHMMVLNGAAVVERALTPLKGIADEVCFVDTGSTDGTPDKIVDLCESLGFEWSYIDVGPRRAPHMHVKDEEKTWKRQVPGPFTGRWILRDWAGARNRSLDKCEGTYILKLDADDEILDPSNILPALSFLDSHPATDFVSCPYEILAPDGGIEMKVLYDRIWRNKPEIRFSGSPHERLSCKGLHRNGQPNWIFVASGLRFRDRRDSPGDGVRLHLRNYKVLLTEHERLKEQGKEPDAFFVMDLAGESIRSDPSLAVELFEDCLTNETFLQVEGFQRSMLRLLGLSHAACGNHDAALLHLRKAVETDPLFPPCLLDLGFLLHRMGDPSWKDVLKRAIEVSDSISRFNVAFADLAKAEKMIGGNDG